MRADEPWRDAVDAPGPGRNRQALQDVIGFWLDRGVAGFRVDMAPTLTWLDRAMPSALSKLLPTSLRQLRLVLPRTLLRVTSPEYQERASRRLP